MTSMYDLIIIGGGPAGLSVAVNAGSENLSTLLLDAKERLGGQAGTSSFIENYPGFACGISGPDLTSQMEEQAKRFDVDMLAPVTAAKIRREQDNTLVVMDDAGECFTSRTVVIASGVRYRRLQLMNLTHYLDRGVTYGSPSLKVDYANQKLFVVGGANSAGQAAVHLSKCTDCEVHIVVRGESLDLKMSHYLIEKINQTSNIIVHTNTSVTNVDGDGTLERLTLTTTNGKTTEMEADQMFVMIGAVPQTTWLSGTVMLDKGYVMAGRDLCEVARQEFEVGCGRLPYDSETSMYGVFAAGDIRANATRRVAAAVGDGSSVVPDIHRYLATLL
jgi:thioredoxin reductase (NADPH)